MDLRSGSSAVIWDIAWGVFATTQVQGSCGAEMVSGRDECNEVVFGCQLSGHAQADGRVVYRNAGMPAVDMGGHCIVHRHLIGSLPNQGRHWQQWPLVSIGDERELMIRGD